MTKTELKIKLATECLEPIQEFVVERNKDGTLRFGSTYNYELAEKIVNFLNQRGIKLDD